MDVSKPDLAVALKDIRVQYESLSSRNQQQAEEWYRSKFSSVTEVAARNNDALKQTKDELSEYRRQLQSRTLEIESLRAHNEALDRQLAEMEDRHSNEIGELQVCAFYYMPFTIYILEIFQQRLLRVSLQGPKQLFSLNDSRVFICHIHSYRNIQLVVK